MPGQYPNGRVAFRRRYIKVFRSDDSGRPMLVLAEVTKGVWEAFNVFPIAERKLEGQRKGLLRFRAAPNGLR